jgi:uncharacterized damage-inducible protein DinB
MTSILKPIADSFHTTNYVLELCLEDMKESDAKERARGGDGPSIAWQVGHMLDFRCVALKLLGVPKESPYSAKYSAKGASDGSDYPAVAAYRREWEQLNTELDSALASANPESLARVTESGVHGKQTALESLVFLTWHEACHIGALVAMRKQLGYPSPAELTLANAAK